MADAAKIGSLSETVSVPPKDNDVSESVVPVVEVIVDARKTGTEEASKTADLKNGVNRRYLGMFFASLTALLYSLSALGLKILNYHPYNVGVWRFGLMIFLTVPFLIHGQFFRKPKDNLASTAPSNAKGKSKGVLNHIWPVNRTTGFVILQALLGSSHILFVVAGIKYMDLADSIVIITSAPVFVTFAAWIFLKERCGIVSTLISVFALIGVAIICKPPFIFGNQHFTTSNAWGAGFSFSAMILLTFCYIVIRFVRKVHHAVVMFMFSVCGLLESAVLGVSFGVLACPQNYYEILLIIGSAISAFLAQTSMTLALKYEQAGVVALLRTMEPMFAYLWQALFLHVQPDLYSCVGAAITITCVAVAALTKTVTFLPDDSLLKKRLGFLMY